MPYPEDRPTPSSKSDSGGSSTTGGASTTGGTTSGTGTSGGGDDQSKPTQKEHKPVLDSNGTWVWEDTDQPLTDQEKKDTGAGGMPNPVDGTDEGFDRDWWRKLPNADPLEIARELKYGIRVDEREGTPYLRGVGLDGTGALIAFLTPQLITKDEGGESVSINLAAAAGSGSATLVTTGDGWGDKPRSMAEALAAPRIRDGSFQSRF